MKNDIRELPWYKGLVERCNNEPDKIHTVFVENGHLGPVEYQTLLDNLADQLDLLPRNAKVMVNLDGMLTDLSKYKLLDKPVNVDLKANDWGNQFQRRDITQTEINDINMEVRKADIDALIRRLSTKSEDFSAIPLVSDASPEELEKIAMLSHEYTHLPPTREILEKEMPNYEEIQPASVEAKKETTKPTNVFHFNQGTEKNPKGFDNNFFDTKVYRKLCELCSRNPKRLFKVYIDQGHLDDEVFKLYVRMYHDRMNREAMPNNLIVDFSGAMDKAYEEYTPEPFVDADKEWFKEFKKECENNPTVMCYKIVRQENMPIGEFLNYVFTMQENLPENARIIRVINEEDRKIPRELEERFKKVDFTVTPPDENGEYKMFGNKLRERRKMAESKKLLPSQEEIDKFLNNPMIRDAIKWCKDNPNGKTSFVISQDGLSDIEFRKRLNFLQYLRMENLIPNNLDFNVESKLGVYEYKPDEPKTMG